MRSSQPDSGDECRAPSTERTRAQSRQPWLMSRAMCLLSIDLARSISRKVQTPLSIDTVEGTRTVERHVGMFFLIFLDISETPACAGIL